MAPMSSKVLVKKQATTCYQRLKRKKKKNSEDSSIPAIPLWDWIELALVSTA